jgi:hypothetical protein
MECLLVRAQLQEISLVAILGFKKGGVEQAHVPE